MLKIGKVRANYMTGEMEKHDIAISVRDLGKCYQIYQLPRDRLKQILCKEPRRYYKELWALRGITFNVRRGHVAGLIGRNGAGKSTLLQILSGIVLPSTGEVRIPARRAAILELGSGISPDHTGRQNALLYAQLLGIPKSEALGRMQTIKRFADLGEFFDRPVRLYSSGMVARLAFAVYAHLDADVLLIDEILAVGDAAFQRKCYERIRRVREQGATIILATHDTTVVRLLCDSALLLEAGELTAFGEPTKVVDKYMSSLFGGISGAGHAWELSLPPRMADTPGASLSGMPSSFTPEFFFKVPAHARYQSTAEDSASDNRKGLLVASLLLNSKGDPKGTIGVGEVCIVRSLLRIGAPCERFWFGVLIRDRLGQNVFGQTASHLALGLKGPFPAHDLITIDFRFRCDLRQDTYFVSLGVGDLLESVVFSYAADVMELKVEARGDPVYGLTNLPFDFSGSHLGQTPVAVGALSFSGGRQP